MRRAGGGLSFHGIGTSSSRYRFRVGLTCLLSTLSSACGGDEAEPTPTPPEFELIAVTFNTGTTDGLPHDAPPEDG